MKNNYDFDTKCFIDLEEAIERKDKNRLQKVICHWRSRKNFEIVADNSKNEWDSDIYYYNSLISMRVENIYLCCRDIGRSNFNKKYIRKLKTLQIKYLQELSDFALEDKKLNLRYILDPIKKASNEQINSRVNTLEEAYRLYDRKNIFLVVEDGFIKDYKKEVI